MTLLILLILGAVGYFYLAHVLNEKKRARLMEKYGDADIVERIMKKMFWQGQTEEQLCDSLGSPVDIDSKVMKTRHRQVWKYQPSGQNRYRLRITVDDGYVVGWDHK
ncbi:DUF2845 domain-containing protein [Delftia acidovorans]